MKRILVGTAAIWVVLSPALARGQQAAGARGPRPPGVEEQLIQLERAFAKADKAKDPAPLDSIIADDWFNTGSQGKLETKKDFLLSVRSNTDVIQSEENFDVKVRVYGNTAVLTGGTREKGTRKGVGYDEVYRWTDVWVKRDGRWQLVVSQSVKAH
jgi:ketosteroid isomerase-like protein